MTKPLADAYRDALRVMERGGPRPLHELASLLSATPATADDDGLLGYLSSAEVSDPLRTDFHVALATWDAAKEAEWAGHTAARTLQRRALILDLLGVSDKVGHWLNEKFHVALEDTTVV